MKLAIKDFVPLCFLALFLEFLGVNNIFSVLTESFDYQQGVSYPLSGLIVLCQT